MSNNNNNNNRAARSTTTFACLNIRSLLSKFEDVDELCRDRDIDLLALTESWHDADSPVLGRLRRAGYSVIDRARPRTADDMSVNHGGIVVIARSNVAVSPIAIADQPSTFEVVCLRAVIGQFAATVVVLCQRPGSQSVPHKFFDELAAILDRVATHQEAIYIVGDFNIRLDRTDDTYADQLRLLVDCYGLVLHDTEPTHQLNRRCCTAVNVF